MRKADLTSQKSAFLYPDYVKLIYILIKIYSMMNLQRVRTHSMKALLLLYMLLLGSLSAFAQDFIIKGRVTDEKGELMTGVSIKEKGTNSITVTDIDGQYSLKLHSEKATLVVTFIGYQAQEVNVNTKDKIHDIMMTENVTSLDEVVVTGYGTQRKISVVGSQTTLKMGDLKVPVSNLTSVLAGRISGVVAVQRTGEPGHDDADIWIRGIASLSGANSKPLILVDGVERTFSNLPPEDIESFTVLKDASATAVYGIRGANGVIIIKTKPGKPGKPQFSVDYYEGVTRLTKKVKLANAYQYMDAANEAYKEQSGEDYYSSAYIDATKKAHGLLPNDNPTMYNQYLYPAVDWMKEVFKDWGHNRRANVSVRGGAPKASYYVSLSYYDESGLTQDSKMEDYNQSTNFRRYNFASNLNLKPSETTTIDIGVNGNLTDGNYPAISSTDIFSACMEINPVYMPLMMPDGTVPGIQINGGFRNPYADLTRRGYRNEFTNTINTNIRVTQDLGFWKWSKGLNVSALVAFDAYNYLDENMGKRESTYWFDGSRDPATGLWLNDVYDENGNYKTKETYEGSSSLGFGKTNYNTRSSYFEASLNYDHVFNEVHRVGALLLFNTKVNSTSKDVNDLYAALPSKTLGIAGRLTYSYNDCYFAEFNVGRNGSDSFEASHRYGTFPAFGIGWAPSNENWWNPVKPYISFLKIRYTDGKVGSDRDVNGDQRYMFLTYIGGASGYNFGNWSGEDGLAISHYGVNVGWSVSHKQDLGFDVKFLKDRLSFNVDLFKEHRTDIFLHRATIPEYAGLTTMPYGNLGVVDNKGIDVQMEYNQKLAKNTFLTLRGNLTWNKSKIIEDDEAPQPYSWMETRGTSINSRWGWIAEGLFTSEDEIKTHAAQFGETYSGQLSKIGDIKYKDLNGDNQINDYDKCRIGHGDVPALTYGFGADLQVGNFSIGALFQGTADADRLIEGSSIRPFNSTSSLDNLFDNIGDRWSADNPTNQDVFYPRLHWGESANTNNNVASTWWQKDVSFLRLKQMSIAYNLPSKWTEKAFIKNAQIYCMGTNLLTFSKFKLWDPELDTNNGTKYPNISTISLGLKFNF